ncbi:peptidylprolyl isomerase [Haloplasma contractile]|uniref:peptidylprolyl isomerase n=1 Tax=Haloplasma contractile SSD-17B TaxID=1033810 RepID=U2DRA4_9MOLU|nr:peptidylprolyl isomerase [Haloplasma contractile]ERJ11107.1 Putative exported isomerase protein [Haloplasma contractile SSD-17B]
MDIKDALLKKGLPIVIVLAIIIGIAIFLSRPETTPTVTNADQVVAKLKGEEVTKGELYERIKNSASLSYILTQSDTAGQLYFLDIIDRELLSDYEHEDIEDDIDKKIQFAKLMQGGEEAYDEFLSSLGLTETEAREYYKISLLRKEAARQRANDEITEDDVTDALNAIRPEVCIIPLRYLSEDAANDALDLANGQNDDLSNEDIKLNFDVEYDSEGNDDIRMTGNVSDTECDYVKLSFEKTANDFPTQLLEYIDNMEDNTYTESPVSFEDDDDDATNDDPYFYLVYKVSTDALPSRDEVRETLITEKVNTEGYMNETIFKLRRDADLKIFDNKLEEAYLSIDEDFEEIEDKSDETVLSFTSNGKKIKLSAEELYQETKMVFGVTKALTTINLGALQSVDDIKLTRQEVRDLKLELKEMKAAFGSQNYAQYGITWEDYLNYYYGVRTEEAALEVMKLNQLQLDYLDHIDPVTEQDIQDAFDDWFRIKATHLLFECDTTKDDIDDKACDLAKTEAEKVITELETVADSKLLVELKAKVDEYTDEDGNFTIEGLKVRTQDLGWFGPLEEQTDQQGQPTGQYKRMVPEFEAAAQAIEVGEITLTPVKTDFGYHIILKTEEEARPEIDTAEYTAIIEKIEAKLLREQKAPERLQKQMAKLRDELEFTFKDDELQDQYEIIQAIYLKEETTEE